MGNELEYTVTFQMDKDIELLPVEIQQLVDFLTDTFGAENIQVSFKKKA